MRSTRVIVGGLNWWTLVDQYSLVLFSGITVWVELAATHMQLMYGGTQQFHLKFLTVPCSTFEVRRYLAQMQCSSIHRIKRCCKIYEALLYLLWFRRVRSSVICWHRGKTVQVMILSAMCAVRIDVLISFLKNGIIIVSQNLFHVCMCHNFERYWLAHLILKCVGCTAVNRSGEGTSNQRLFHLSVHFSICLQSAPCLTERKQSCLILLSATLLISAFGII